MKKRALQKQQTRARVLRCARESFEEVGYEATTIQRVARRAGVAAGTVLSHFPDKPALVSAAFHAVLQERIELGFGALPDAGALAQLDHLARTLYGWYAAQPALAQALVRETLFLTGEQGNAHAEQLQDFLDRVAPLLAAGMQAGELRALPVAQDLREGDVILEIGGVKPPEPQVIPAQFTFEEPYDCLVGEKIWRRMREQYFWDQ